MAGISTRAMVQVVGERESQEARRESGEWSWTLRSEEVSDAEKLPVLAEEFGEVARAILTGDDEIQVAACSIAWLESIAHRLHPPSPEMEASDATG